MKLHLETIENASARASDVVSQLLYLSRQKELTFRPVDLNSH